MKKTMLISGEQFQNMTTSERCDFESFITGCALGFSGTIFGERIDWSEGIVFSSFAGGGMKIEYS